MHQRPVVSTAHIYNVKCAHNTQTPHMCFLLGIVHVYSVLAFVVCVAPIGFDQMFTTEARVNTFTVIRTHMVRDVDV